MLLLFSLYHVWCILKSILNKMSPLILLAVVAFVGAEESENLVRVNFNSTCEAQVNSLIQQNLAATYQYLVKASHFRQYDSEYAGMAVMFSAHSREKLNDAKHLMRYLVHRGAEVQFGAIAAPGVTDWSHPSELIRQALDIEKTILKQIIATHTCAQETHDPDLMHDMADVMIIEEENTIFELASYIQHFAHDGASDSLVLPALSQTMLAKYKDYQDCFRALDETPATQRPNY